MMDMDPGVVVSPGELAAGLAAGADFDVSRVRTPLRALLPPRPAPRHLAQLCTDKPIYPLTRDVAVVSKYRTILIQSISSFLFFSQYCFATCQSVKSPLLSSIFFFFVIRSFFGIS